MRRKSKNTIIEEIFANFEFHFFYSEMRSELMHYVEKINDLDLEFHEYLLFKRIPTGFVVIEMSVPFDSTQDAYLSDVLIFKTFEELDNRLEIDEFRITAGKRDYALKHPNVPIFRFEERWGSSYAYEIYYRETEEGPNFSILKKTSANGRRMKLMLDVSTRKLLELLAEDMRQL